MSIPNWRHVLAIVGNSGTTEGGKPLTNANVQLEDISGIKYTGAEIVDDVGTRSGRYEWASIPAGRYKLIVNLVETGQAISVGSGEVAGLGYENGKFIVSGTSSLDYKTTAEVKTALALDQVSNIAIPVPVTGDNGKLLQVNIDLEYKLVEFTFAAYGTMTNDQLVYYNDGLLQSSQISKTGKSNLHFVSWNGGTLASNGTHWGFRVQENGAEDSDFDFFSFDISRDDLDELHGSIKFNGDGYASELKVYKNRVLFTDLAIYGRYIRVQAGETQINVVSVNGLAIADFGGSGTQEQVVVFHGAVIPTSTGLDFGLTSLRWNGYFNTINATGTATMAGINASAPVKIKASSVLRENWTDFDPATKFAVFCHIADESSTGGRVVIEPTGQVNVSAKTGTVVSLRVNDSQRLSISDTAITAVVQIVDNNALKVTGAAFAEIHVHDASTAQSIPTGATYTKITSFTDNGFSENCIPDVANDKIIATKTGIYKVLCEISASSGTVSLLWNASVFMGGVEQNNVHWQRKISTAGDVGSMSMSGYIDVTSANTDIDVRVRHNGGASANFTVVYANLNVQRVSDT